MLEANKKKYGFSFNFQINFAIFKYLILDSRIPYWKLDDRPDPHYEDINKLPEDVKLSFGEKEYKGHLMQKTDIIADSDVGTINSKPRGKK